MHLEKRILVTGGSGFLGSHLCERLLADGANVICVDNFFSGTRSNIEHLPGHKRFELRPVAKTIKAIMLARTRLIVCRALPGSARPGQGAESRTCGCPGLTPDRACLVVSGGAGACLRAKAIMAIMPITTASRATTRRERPGCAAHRGKARTGYAPSISSLFLPKLYEYRSRCLFFVLRQRRPVAGGTRR